jgi:hypothetical protein
MMNHSLKRKKKNSEQFGMILTKVIKMGKNHFRQEIRLEKDGWHWVDLTYLAGTPAANGYSYPWPYNRSAPPGSAYSSHNYLPLIEIP